MEFKQLYVCQDCKTFNSANPEKTLNGCPECKGKLVYVPIRYEKYAAFTPEEKEAFKKNFLEGNNVEQLGVNQTVQRADEDYMQNHADDTVRSTGWVKGLRFVGWVVFIFFALLGVAAFGLLAANPFVALLCAGVLVCIGFMTVAMTMVFLDMANDIRAIRKNTKRK